MSRAGYNFGESIAYFITWTTYGTWLPGDDRWWNRKDASGPQAPNKLSHESAESKMKEQAFFMTDDQRRIVQQTIRRHCQIRNWTLHAVNARSNHVHVVVTAPDYQPETVRDQFKAWCTRKLKGVVPDRVRFWTEGASCRWINTDAELESVVVYALEAQDRMDREQK